jgi:hypothetical protein
MCIPVAAAGLLISAVSVGLSAAQANANNQTQKKALEAQNTVSKMQTAELQKQINAKSEQERSERAAAAMRERASLRVAAGEAGVGGAGVSILENQADRNAAMDMGIIESNRSNASRQANLEQAGISAGIEGKKSALPSKAAVWGQAGLQIAGDYASTSSKQGTFDARKWPKGK